MFPTWLFRVLFFSILISFAASQLFWTWQARRVVRARRTPLQRWLLGLVLYGALGAVWGVCVVVPLRWALLRDAPVLWSLFAWVRRPEVMVPVGLWMIASAGSFFLMVLVQAPGLVRRALRRKNTEALPQPERRHFLQTATYMAGAFPFVMVGYGFLIGRQNYRVQEVTVSLPNLPRELDGLRLLQLTDVHAGAYMSVKEIRRVVGLARELEPDLVFHTGDFLTGRSDPLPQAVAELARAQGRYGSFGCLGNHEIYARAQDKATELFARQGVRILRGQNVELEIRGVKLNLIGVDYQRQPRGRDPVRWRSYFLRGVETLVRPNVTNILLSHNPNSFVRAAELGIQLTLAGHTHGGQVRVEILDSRWSPARFMTPFVSGLFQRSSGVSPDQQSFLYVSRGIGTVGVPVRLNAPPEITLLILRRG